MGNYSELEILGGRKRALQNAERCIKNKPVKTTADDLALSEIRVQKRNVNRELKAAAGRAQMKLAFYSPAPPR